MRDLRVPIVYHLVDELVDHDEVFPHQLLLEAAAEVVDHMRDLVKQLQHERGQHVSLLGGEHEEELVALDVHELDALLLLRTHCGQIRYLTKKGAVRFRLSS